MSMSNTASCGSCRQGPPTVSDEEEAGSLPPRVDNIMARRLAERSWRPVEHRTPVVASMVQSAPVIMV